MLVRLCRDTRQRDPTLTKRSRHIKPEQSRCHSLRVVSYVKLPTSRRQTYTRTHTHTRIIRITTEFFITRTLELLLTLAYHSARTYSVPPPRHDNRISSRMHDHFFVATLFFLSNVSN